MHNVCLKKETSKIAEQPHSHGTLVHASLPHASMYLYRPGGKHRRALTALVVLTVAAMLLEVVALVVAMAAKVRLAWERTPPSTPPLHHHGHGRYRTHVVACTFVEM